MGRFNNRVTPSKAVVKALKPATTDPSISEPWTRPSDWLTMPDTSSGQKIAILIAVYDNPVNYFAITISGAYNIDWGDGTNTNYTAGTKASKDFSYAAITTDTATQKNTLFRGYRQQLIVITPQAANNLTSINFNVKHANDTRSTTYAIDSQILDINMVGSSINTLRLGDNSSNMHLRHLHLENFTFTGSNAVTIQGYSFAYSALRKFSMDCSAVTSASYMFYNCRRLTDVTITTDSSLTSTDNMFNGCNSLIDAPYFDTQSVTACNSMFSNCYSLQNVPWYNWASATNAASFLSNCQSIKRFSGNFPAAATTGSMFLNCYALEEVNVSIPAATTWSQMFQECRSLKKVGYTPTASVTTFSSAFYNCYSLESIDWIINCTAATTMFNMFYQNYNLKYVAGFSSLGGITTTGHMFNTCVSLLEPPDMSGLDTTHITANYMFNNCGSLKHLPDMGNTSAISSWSYFAFGCASIRSVPAYDFTSAASMAGAFQNCYALETGPTIGGNPTDLSTLFSGCGSLTTAPSVSVSSATTVAQMFESCYSMRTTPTSYATTSATTVQNMFSGCTALAVLPDIDTRKVANANGSFLSSAYSARKILKTEFPQGFSVAATGFSAAALNAIYTLLPDRTARTINNVTNASGTVTYTTTAAHGYQKGMTITVTGVNPAAYNLATVLIASVPTTTTFTVTNAATGTYVSGGTVTPAAATITVTGAEGASADTPSIATTKGWTVTG